MKTLNTLRDEQAYKEIQDYLTLEVGPPPINPFKDLRKTQGLSIQELALSAGVGTTTIKKAESGCFVNPLPTLLHYWTQKHPKTTEGPLTQAYHDFKYLMRQRNFIYFGKVFPDHTFAMLPPDAVFSTTHPLTALRVTRPNPVPENLRRWSKELDPVGRHRLALDLCVPQESIESFEKAWRRIQSPPRELLNALSHCGYPDATLSIFCNLYTNWRERMIRERALSSK